MRWVEEGSLRLIVSAILPLADAAESHRRLESRQSFGKIVLDADA
ncbi:MAG TPA: zinc-binding dehydrogenase [Thermoanaerobaculia bacterium]|nr:zinc-binding dehydrogenase [Thermoanaerobaculia bacterium]